jgi:hypothetical protein
LAVPEKYFTPGAALSLHGDTFGTVIQRALQVFVSRSGLMRGVSPPPAKEFATPAAPMNKHAKRNAERNRCKQFISHSEVQIKLCSRALSKLLP